MPTRVLHPGSPAIVDSSINPRIRIGHFGKLALPVAFLLVAMTPIGKAESNDDKIVDAMRAAPPSISGLATVRDRPSEPGGEMPILRQGSNGWTCFPDDPKQPGHSPACFDEEWIEMLRAMAQKRKPAIAKIGTAYLLQGGPPKSNVDPSAKQATPDNEWIGPAQPPFVAVVFPDPAVLDNISTDPNNGGPWVMWRGTPYVHLMIPVPRYRPDEE